MYGRWYYRKYCSWAGSFSLGNQWKSHPIKAPMRCTKGRARGRQWFYTFDRKLTVEPVVCTSDRIDDEKLLLLSSSFPEVQSWAHLRAKASPVIYLSRARTPLVQQINRCSTGNKIYGRWALRWMPWIKDEKLARGREYVYYYATYILD